MAQYNLDPIANLLVSNGIPLTKENWIEVNWFGEKTEADLGPEELREIPSYLNDASSQQKRGRPVDILSGLKDKLRFVERHYATASKLFLDRQTNIEEAGGDVDEWMEADESLNLLGQSALQLVQRALRDYLNCFVALTRLQPPSSKNWWVSYKEYFLRTFGIDWDDAPVSPSELEEINFARNDSEHGSEAIGMDRRQSRDHQQRFPGGLFVDELDMLPEIVERWPRRIYVTGERLIECIRRVETFCEFLDANRRLALRRTAVLIRSQTPIK